jgi:hypothetical protein
VNALTRRLQDKFSNEYNVRIKHMHQILLSIARLDDKVKERMINDMKIKEEDVKL